MSNILFSSDYHFGHKNILNFCASSRPFATVEEMNDVIIETHNKHVGPRDVFYFLGDFTFYRDADEDKVKKLFDALNGDKHLIEGNHDHSMTRSLGWSSITKFNVVKQGKKRIVVCHYPLVEHDGYNHNKRATPVAPSSINSVHLYGHVHSSIAKPYYTPNVWAHDAGYDRNRRPISFDEVFQHFEEPFL